LFAIDFGTRTRIPLVFGVDNEEESGGARSVRAVSRSGVRSVRW
jgi:hypothetical protein